jgi:hypothetical protein
MQGYRVRALIMFAALLALDGCNESAPPPKPVPKPAAVQPQTAPANVTLNVDTDVAGSTHDYDVHTTGVTTDSAVTWNYGSAFDIVFTNVQSTPCQEKAPDSSKPFEYPSSPTGSSTTPFTFKCTLKAGFSGTHIWYRFKSQAAQTVKGKSKVHNFTTTGHCEGCVIDPQ